MKGSCRCLSVVLLFSAWSVFVIDAAADPGFYLSNSTHLLYIESTSVPTPHVLHAEPLGRIVGVAPDVRNGYLFWSDISNSRSAIYRGTLNGRQPLSDVTRLTNDGDVIEANGLSVDWVSRNVYWTDARKRTLNVVDYDGHNKRILGISGLLMPRAVYADPIGGYLYWGDQGTRRIERSRLDGTGRQIVASDDVIWPNEIQVHNFKLYWVDAWTKSLMRSNPDGSDVTRVTTISATGESIMFGLTFRATSAFISVWQKGEVLQLDLENPTRVTAVFENLGTDAMFGLAFVDSNLQPLGDNPCGRDGKGGCSHLCLPTDVTSYRCSCPSFGGLALSSDTKSCREPLNLLFYTLGDWGKVGFIDLNGAQSPDLNLVGTSLRPVAVTYDPVVQQVYWSDVHERTVHRANLDGSGHEVFLSNNHSLGIVDGLAFDVIHRHLYYTNVGQVAHSGVSYSWHKVELIGADGTGRRVIYSGGERPRGLMLDVPNARIYHTDWGSQAGVWTTQLDGSQAQQTFANMDNPNGIARMGTRFFVIDSHAKTRDPANPNYPGPSRNGSLYSCQGTCESFTELPDAELLTPFGITADDSHVYVTDWDRKSILKITMSGNDQADVTELLSNVPTPMGVYFSPRTAAPLVDMLCHDGGAKECKEVCLLESPTERVCACDSYDANVLSDDETSCNGSSEFYLVADMNGIRLRGIQTADVATYTIVQGSSYFSNFPSLAHDPSERRFYFSDVARRRIYSANLDGTDTLMFYQSPHIIDGLAVNHELGFVYWTDYLTGVIARLHRVQTPSGFGPASSLHEDFIIGLSQPRAIRLDVVNNFIYWTEWGRNPRVARANLQDGTGITTLLDGVLVRPNGLALHGDKFYVGDAGNSTVWECSLDGQNCQILDYMTGVAHNLYDLQRYEDWLIYSDWGDHKVKVVSMVTGQESVVMEGLMRPSQFHLLVTSALACPADHTCPETCMPYPGGYQCRCDPGRKLDSDGVTCIDVPGGWEVAPCSPGISCSEYAQCAREAGTLHVRCQCIPGYEDSGNGTCRGCTSGQFKPYIGPARCAACPAGSTTTLPESTACECQNGFVWDWTSLTCQGHKPGTCPNSLPTQGQGRNLCGTSCSNDLDCPSAQKCCDDLCPSGLCVDPVGLDQCVYQGHAYQIGESFSPDACTHCECLSTKPPGSDYGQATCHKQTCPTLPCGEHVWIQEDGVCCPRCPSSPQEQVLEILNCPTEPVHINTDPDKSYVLYDPELQVRDNLYLSREITLTVTPNVTRFWWLGQGARFYQNVSVVASARAPTGIYDTSHCNYSVYVTDVTPPVLTCPEDIHIYTAAQNARVVWPDPVATDNVGLLGVPKTDTSIPAVLDIGRHPVTYTVRDKSGNPGRCTMHVTITNTELECPNPPSVPHGNLDCDEFDGCYLDCHEGYTRNSLLDVPKAYDCVDGQWQPDFRDYFSIEACIRVRSERWWGSGNLEFLPSVGESSEVDVEAGFREYVKREYLHDLHLEPLVHVDVKSHAISRKKRDIHQKFTISFKFEGPDNFTSVLIGEDFRSMLFSMNRAVDQSRFKIVGNGETLTARRYSLHYEPPRKQCGAGEQMVDDGCLVCMIGTYFNNITCTICPANTYNGLEGQTSCASCPYGKYSQQGSYSPYQCTTYIEGATVGGIKVSIIAGACAGVVAIIIIAVVIFALTKVTRRLLSKNSGLDGAVQFDNVAFADEDPYAELPADKVDSF